MQVVTGWVKRDIWNTFLFLLLFFFLQHNDSLILQPLSQSYFRTFLVLQKEIIPIYSYSSLPSNSK